MEVLHRPGALYGSQHAAMYPPSVQRMFMTPADVYSCYPFEANTPSRTPTPEKPVRGHKQGPSATELASHATTLQSVLRGEIPEAYSHLATSSSSSWSSSSNSTSLRSSTRISSGVIIPSSSSSTSSNSLSSTSPAQQMLSSYPLKYHHHSHPAMDMDHIPQPLIHPAPSPCPSHNSSLSYSPRPQSHESHASQDSVADPQTEPMDLSCKKPSRKRTAGSAFQEVRPSSSGGRNSPVLSSSLPAKFCNSRTSSDFLSSSSSSSTSSRHSSSSPSMTSSSTYSFPPSPCEGQQGEEFSLLRNLLSVGKQGLKAQSNLSSPCSQSAPNLSDRGCDSPASDSFPRTPVTGSTKVQLAKKNLFPVSARVSDWLVKIVQFAKSIPEFSTLSHNDKITLILNSWSRLMLLYMAESNFQFAVSPIPTTADTTSSDSVVNQDEPTMKSIEGVQTFIKKCQQMSVDSKEYDFLRMLVLFNSGYVGLSCPESIDQLNSVVQQLLQQHVRVSKPKDVMHYSRLLMCLPSLYGINSKMFETFFCTHISKSTDMEVLLKELLQSIS